MTERPPARGRLLSESALGALLGALLVYAGLRLAGVLSPIGTVAVPVLAFPVSTFVIFVLHTRANGPDRS